MKTRIITAIILATIAGIGFYVGGLLLRLGALAFLLAGLYELFNATKQHSIALQVVLYIVASIIYFMYPSELAVPTIGFLIWILACFMASIIVEEFTVEKAMCVMGLGMLVITGYRGITNITILQGFRYIVYIALATFGCDSGAYFVGITMGKHKLIERLSPKKTIEGSIGGIILGTVAAVIFAVVMEMNMPLWQEIVLAFILTITAQFGDLTFSALKRHFGIKDFSNIFPGHGGVLDRTDSLVFNIVVYVIWFTIF